MEFKLVVISVACFACLVPQAFGIGSIAYKLASAVKTKKAILGAGVQAKGHLVKGLLGAKKGIISSVIANKPSIFKPKPCHATKPTGSVPDKVSGLMNIIHNGAKFKANLVGKLLGLKKSKCNKKTATAKRTPVYQIIRGPVVYPATLIQRF